MTEPTINDKLLDYSLNFINYGNPEERLLFLHTVNLIKEYDAAGKKTTVYTLLELLEDFTIPF